MNEKSYIYEQYILLRVTLVGELLALTIVHSPYYTVHTVVTQEKEMKRSPHVSPTPLSTL